jgi:hypothetical protein
MDGRIETTWTDGPADIGRYNEDCRSMAEVLGWLNGHPAAPAASK